MSLNSTAVGYTLTVKEQLTDFTRNELPLGTTRAG